MIYTTGGNIKEYYYLEINYTRVLFTEQMNLLENEY